MPSQRPARILVVDDEPSVRRLVAAILGRAGYETVEAGDGEEAIRRLADDPSVALVVSDIRMPDISGLDVVAAAQARRPGLPVILTTGAASPDERSEAASRGAIVVEKPFSFAQLEAAVARALDGRTGTTA